MTQIIEIEKKVLTAIARKLPPHMQGGMERYLVRGIKPGDFMLELLQGKVRAFFRADDTNMAAFPEWLSFLYNNMPMGAWGDEEKVKRWMENQRGEVNDAD